MTTREKSEILETLKAEDNPSFESVEVVSVKDIETKFGPKTIMTIADGENKFNVFLNTYSLNKLIDAFGNEDKKWIGEFVKISVQKDEHFNKDMIVVE